MSKAINTINGEGRTPLQVALIKKAEKGNHLSQMKTIFDLGKKYDNTTKFCAKLLEIGADSRSLKLKDREFHTEKYYCTLRNLENYSKTPQEGKVKAKELRKKLEKNITLELFQKNVSVFFTKQEMASKLRGNALTLAEELAYYYQLQ